jgi:hypothetical protein
VGWIDVRVTLKVHEAGCVPQVRIWVDLEPERGLGNELELALRERDGDWVGSFRVDERRTNGFLYRLGLFAHPGAHFWLHVRMRELERELLVDGDLLAASKSMLVGTCAVGCAGRSARRAPSLVLLTGGKAATALSPDP